MRYKLLLSFLIMVFGYNLSSAQAKKNVLFVGNSLTSYNEMPQMLQKMLDEKGIKIQIDQVTSGGETLTWHAVSTEADNLGRAKRAENGEIPATVKKILSKNWDAVVLQEATIQALIPDEFRDCTQPSVIFLDSIIKSAHGKTILYQAFTGTSFPVRYCHTFPHPTLYNMQVFKPSKIEQIDHEIVLCSDSFKNSSEEYQAIKKTYNELAAKTGAGIAQVGYAYELCKKLYPSIQLYGPPNGNHPSPAGSYLIACVFFKKITSQSLKDIKYHGAIDVAVAAKLRNIVDSNL